MATYPQSDIRLKRDTWYLTADQQVFAPSVACVAQSVVVILNGCLQTQPGVFSVDTNGVVTMNETCLAGDTVVLRYTEI